MNPIPSRVVIYTKDVCNITGMSAKAARKLLRQIRKQQGKPPGCFVTIEDFCSCTLISEEVVRPFLAI